MPATTYPKTRYLLNQYRLWSAGGWQQENLTWDIAETYWQESGCPHDLRKFWLIPIEEIVRTVEAS